MRHSFTPLRSLRHRRPGRAGPRAECVDRASAVGRPRAEAVSEAVSSCAKQGYRVTAAIIDTDGIDQAVLRGDGAMMTTLDAARDKAYTALMLGAARGEESSGAVATRMGANAPAGGLVKLPHVLMAQGALVIRAGGEPVAAIGVGGAPGGGLDEACARAGLDKISDRLK